METAILGQTVMIVAGEASGDLHAAGLVCAMKRRIPQLSFFGMGGIEMERQGVRLLHSADSMAVMGLAEVAGKIFEILAVLKSLKQEMKKRQPALLILVDFADFNLRLAKFAHEQGIPVYYYITPKVWVWRSGRAKKLARYTDCAGVILPFEEDFLQKRGVVAHYVGNPVVDSARIRFDREAFCRKYAIDSDKVLVGLLPGSRKKEVASLFPLFLAAAKRMKTKYARDLLFLIPLASTLTMQDLNTWGLAAYEKEIDIRVFPEDRYEMMAACDGVVAASGTVTLELALLDVPMVVTYKLAPLTHFIGKFFIHLPHFSLVNIIAKKEVVTELLQDQVEPKTIEFELARILFDQDVRKRMRHDFSEIRQQLGTENVSEKSAELALATMRKK